MKYKMVIGGGNEVMKIDREQIIEDLGKFINQHNMDSAASTPDFILAEMVYGFYESYVKATKKNIKWHTVQVVKEHDRIQEVVNDK